MVIKRVVTRGLNNSHMRPCKAVTRVVTSFESIIGSWIQICIVLHFETRNQTGAGSLHRRDLESVLKTAAIAASQTLSISDLQENVQTRAWPADDGALPSKYPAILMMASRSLLERLQ